MAKLFEQLQNRASLTESIRALMDKCGDGKEMSAEAKDQLTKMEGEFDSLNAKIQTEQKQLDRERVIGEKIADAVDNGNTKHAELLTAFSNVLRHGTVQAKHLYTALQMDNPTQAGYLVAPEKFVSELIKELADTTFMRQKARVLPPLRFAQSLGYPTQTGAMSSFTWGTELQAPTADTSLAFGKREFKPHAGTSEILISKTLARNVADIDALIRNAIAEEIGAALEEAYMTGDGVNKPLGLFTASADGINTDRDVYLGNTATEMKFDGLIEAQYSLKTQYQAGAEWVFNRLALKQLAKLKNSDGQYIWQAAVTLGTPNMLLGKPVNITEFAPSTFTAGLYAGLYGNLKGYWIVDSLAMEIQVLNELYARTNQVDYLARVETDGAPVEPWSFVRIRLA